MRSTQPSTHSHIIFILINHAFHSINHLDQTLLGRKFDIPFKGETGFSYITDIARIFLGCSRTTAPGSHCFNIRGELNTVEK
jgi:hypothetical protein